MVPASSLDPPYISIQSRDVSIVNLLKEIIQESAKLHWVVFLEPIPPSSVTPHVIQHWCNELICFFCGDVWVGLSQVIGIHSVRILSPSLTSTHGWLPQSVRLVRRFPAFPPGTRSSPWSRALGAILSCVNHTWSPPRGRSRGGRFCPSILRKNASSPSYGNISLGLRSSWSQYLRRSRGLWGSSASSSSMQICYWIRVPSKLIWSRRPRLSW